MVRFVIPALIVAPLAAAYAVCLLAAKGTE